MLVFLILIFLYIFTIKREDACAKNGVAARNSLVGVELMLQKSVGVRAYFSLSRLFPLKIFCCSLCKHKNEISEPRALYFFRAIW